MRIIEIIEKGVSYMILPALYNTANFVVSVKREEKRLAVVRTSNAVCPLVFDDIPLIALDMWEVTILNPYNICHCLL
ncbi:Superoxide dismutase [Fe] 3, chloroplastic [Dendrobium catenatum]|uniref:Superoxide dismutase [Fe] 3, chloroplastic n=1 Tax=Dendrobium catenatum TaxID=906689 RepID=A0A2I0VQ62_9ASPA|nr:Superoxide dismutase [Fe] 3, chloroplastic [Dendrobium catenatum]